MHCHCGCGEKTNIYRGKPRKYISGHHARGANNGRAGKKVSEETRQKISRARKAQGATRAAGWKHNEEARKKMVKRWETRKPTTPRTGPTIQCETCGEDKYVPPHKAETARFCSLSCLGKATTPAGKANPFYGKKHTEEAKEQIRQAALQQRAAGFVLPSTPERIVHEELHRRGIAFETEVLLADKFCVDIFIPELNLVIFVDGCYWHACPDHCPDAKRPQSDNARVPYLTKCGFEVVLIWEHSIMDDVQAAVGDSHVLLRSR